MREFLASGKVGNIELNAQKKIRESIVKRWDELHFLEGLPEGIRENVATIYENEARHLMNEATAADNSGSFETVVFPIIRRIFSKLLANEIVSVQAMNMPIGKLFYIMPVTSERQWDLQVEGELSDGDTGRHTGLMGYTRQDRNNNGNPVNRYYLPDEVINTDDAGNLPEPVQFMKKSLYDLFYNDFLYDNSKGKITIRLGEATPVYLGPQGYVQADSNLAQYRLSGLDGSLRNIILRVNGFSAFNAGRLTGPDGNEMDTEAFLASLKVIVCNPIDNTEEDGGFSTFEKYESIPFRLVTQRYGKGIVEYDNICDANGDLYIELDLAKPVRKQGATLDGYIGVDPKAFNNKNAADMFKIAWAQYDSLELETEIGEVSFKLESVTVSVEERKLRATWSPELAQDVAAFHNIDAEAELTAILSEQISAEIDREILRDIRKAAPWQARWDVNGWRRMAGHSTNYTQKDWNQELMTKVNQISAQIHKATLRGGANWIVVSSEISAVFDNLEYFHVTDASAESDQYNMGIERVGSLNGRYQVYRDPYAPHWSLIMGHKGKSLLDTGYIYAPYVPLQLTPVMYNPFNFAPLRGIMTRYAKKCVNNRFFGAVIVDGLQTWNINELR